VVDGQVVESTSASDIEIAGDVEHRIAVIELPRASRHGSNCLIGFERIIVPQVDLDIVLCGAGECECQRKRSALCENFVTKAVYHSVKTSCYENPQIGDRLKGGHARKRHDSGRT
jgi:hypothetical protein